MSEVWLKDKRADIRNGDLLLFRGSGLLSRLIQAAGRSAYSHAAKAVWWHGELFCVEVREFHGGRAVTLASQVQRYPGQIDVFEANAKNRWVDFDRNECCRVMLSMAGCDYGYFAVLLAALRHLPVVRLFVTPNDDDFDESGKSQPFCSHACAIADRAGGTDPVPHLADRVTEPADLARSPFYAYRFTLAG